MSRAKLFLILVGAISFNFADSGGFIVVTISQLSGGTFKALPFAIPIPKEYYLVRHPFMKPTNMYVHKDDLVSWQKKIHTSKKEQMFSFPYFLFENSSTVSFDDETKQFSTERFGSVCGGEKGTFHREKTVVGTHYVCEIIGRVKVPELPDRNFYVHIFYVDMNYEGWVWTAMYVVTQPAHISYETPQIWLDIRKALSEQNAIPAQQALQVRHFRPIFDDDSQFPEDIMANDRSSISIKAIEKLRKGKITISELLSNPQNIASDILTFKKEQKLKLTTGRNIRFNKLLNFNSVLSALQNSKPQGAMKMYGDRFFINIFALGDKVVYSVIKHDPESEGLQDLSLNRNEITNDDYINLIRNYAKQRTDEFRKYHDFM